MSDMIGTRVLELQQLIPRIGNLRYIYRLGRRRNIHGRLYELDYAVCIKKNAKCFLDRVAEFDSVLRGALAKGEELRYDDQAFLVVGYDYRIRYVFEGYKKQCDKIGYMEDGKPQFRMLHRMGVSLAFRHYRIRGYNRAEIESRMFNGDWTDPYPNPGDRFVAICHHLSDCRRYPSVHDLYPISDCRIRWLLAEGEGPRIEYKSCTNGVFDDTFETVCSFLNRMGGDILLGVNDHGKPIGISKEEAFGIVKQVVDMCNSQLLVAERGNVVVSPLSYNHRTIIHIHVSEGRYAFFKGERYFRYGDSDRVCHYLDASLKDRDMRDAVSVPCNVKGVV